MCQEIARYATSSICFEKQVVVTHRASYRHGPIYKIFHILPIGRLRWKMKDLLLKYKREMSLADRLCEYDGGLSRYTFLMSGSRCRPTTVAVGYCFGVICSFILNRRFTFRDGERRLWGQMFLFAAFNLGMLGLSSWIVGRLVSGGLNIYLAKIPVTVFVMVCNYFGYKLIVFRVKRT
jgi:putative flippase GtrA